MPRKAKKTTPKPPLAAVFERRHVDAARFCCLGQGDYAHAIYDRDLFRATDRHSAIRIPIDTTPRGVDNVTHMIKPEDLALLWHGAAPTPGSPKTVQVTQDAQGAASTARMTITGP